MKQFTYAQYLLISTLISGCALEPKEPYYWTDAEIIAKCRKAQGAFADSVCNSDYVKSHRKIWDKPLPKITMYEALGVTPEMVQRQREQDRREAASILGAAADSIAQNQVASETSSVNATTPSKHSTLPTTPVQSTATTTQIAQQQTPTSNISSVTGSRSQPVMQCVLVTPTEGNGWFSMKNTCNYMITVSWCYAGTSDCRNGDWGFTNTGNISAGGTRSASTFTGRAERKGLAYAACSGRDVYIQETGPKMFDCK